MKLIAFLFTLTLSAPAFATDLVCTMARPYDFFYGETNTFTITNIEGDEFSLEVSLDDQNTMSVERDAKVTGIYLSNECDNNYSITLPTVGLNRLLAGKAKGIPGKLDFESAGEREFHTNLICRIAKNRQ